jgi:transcriptional antiterminator RfaH
MNTAFSPITASPAAAAWYCLRVLARREDTTARHLEQRAGVRVFSPRVAVRRENRAGLMASVTEALFPGYVFARFQYPHELRRVASTPGVVGLVRFGGEPPVVADDVIARLESAVREATATPAPAFAEGAWVRVVAGCFRGSEGRVLGAAASRVRILLTLLGQEIQISVPGDQLADSADGPAGHFPADLRAGGVSSPVPR